MLPWFLVFLAAYVPLRLWFLAAVRKKQSGKAIDAKYEILQLLFFMSLVAVLSQTLTSDGTFGGMAFGHILDKKYISLKPFKIFRVIGDKSGSDRISYITINLVGNIAMFVPFAFLLRACKRCGVFTATLAGFGLSLFIEIYQLLLPRHTDIDDLILNTLGALIGALLFIPFRRVWDNGKKDIKARCIRQSGR
ncbi:MAG: VanZ family protein [Clostridia bacterium]|nr:VanZ family protein [Clostridia bacterium]